MSLDAPQIPAADTPEGADAPSRQFSLRRLLVAFALFGLILAPIANFGTAAFAPMMFIAMVTALAVVLSQIATQPAGRMLLVWRLGFVVLTDIAFVLLFFPYGGSQPPSSNLMTGPLWLFVTRGVEDKIVGTIWATVALGLMNVFVFAPLVRTSVFLVAGLMVWIGAALYLSMLYAV